MTSCKMQFFNQAYGMKNYILQWHILVSLKHEGDLPITFLKFQEKSFTKVEKLTFKNLMNIIEYLKFITPSVDYN